MTTTISRLEVSASELPEEVSIDPSAEIPAQILQRIEQPNPAPWDALGDELAQEDPIADGKNALAVRRHCRFDRRTAADPAVWHHATVVQLRDYVIQRWADKGHVKSERLLGSVRRNALAHLWWMVEALDADGAAPSELIERAIGSTARFRLQLVDFNGFHGRPWLARAVAEHLVPEGGPRPKDKRVDEFFKALGQISAVRVLDRFEESPDVLIRLVEDELEDSSSEEP